MPYFVGRVGKLECVEVALLQPLAHVGVLL
jgi:hypothetical protein